MAQGKSSNRRQATLIERTVIPTPIGDIVHEIEHGPDCPKTQAALAEFERQEAGRPRGGHISGVGKGTAWDGKAGRKTASMLEAAATAVN